ncbi:MAG: hypothetical protein OHK0039_34490 [Bacteroidia bacterium]
MAEGKPVIFLAFANDQQEQARYLRGLADELRGIRNALGAARQAQAVEIVERANATLTDILDVFQDPAYSGRISIFHYGGHADSYRLMLESDDGRGRDAYASGLSAFLANQPGLKLVFLNGCSTREQALELRAAGIPAVIATSDVISDEVARRFALRFYKGLGGYATIQKSFSDATAEVLTLTGATNYRSLYLGDLEEAPQAYPWSLYPDPAPDWRLDPGKVRGPARADDLKIGKYAHVLCNRYQQNDEFVSSQLRNVGGPMAYIIHGPRDERHESLITRFSYEHIGLPRQYIRPIEIKNWPFKGDLDTLLKARLAEQFESLNRSDKPIQALMGSDILLETKRSGQEAIIIQHNIPAEYWNKETAALLRWYIGEFWNVEPGVSAEAPRFVIFLNVLYSNEIKTGNFVSQFFSKTYVKSKIVAELKQVAAACPQRCVLLSELDGIRRPHVEDWLIETNLAEVDELADLPERIFTDNARRLDYLTMAKIEPHLKGAIKLMQDKYALQQF